MLGRDPDGCSGNGVTPLRSAGDLLIQYGLSRGGTVPTLFLSKWVTTGASSQCEASNSVPCWGEKDDLSASGEATGSINTSAITSNILPALDNSDGLGAHSPRTFGEAQVSMDAIFGEGECESFGSAYLKSRSSDSFTSALKDFVPPADVNVVSCASVEVTKTGSDGGS